MCLVASSTSPIILTLSFIGSMADSKSDSQPFGPTRTSGISGICCIAFKSVGMFLRGSIVPTQRTKGVLIEFFLSKPSTCSLSTFLFFTPKGTTLIICSSKPAFTKSLRVVSEGQIIRSAFRALFNHVSAKRFPRDGNQLFCSRHDKSWIVATNGRSVGGIAPPDA